MKSLFWLMFLELKVFLYYIIEHYFILWIQGIYLDFRKNWRSCNFDNVIPSKKMFCYYYDVVVVVLVATRYLRRKRLCIFFLTKLFATLIFTISTSSFSQKRTHITFFSNRHVLKAMAYRQTHILIHTQEISSRFRCVLWRRGTMSANVCLAASS